MLAAEIFLQETFPIDKSYIFHLKSVKIICLDDIRKTVIMFYMEVLLLR